MKRKQAITHEPDHQKPLWLWPGVIILMVQWLVRFGIPIVIPEALGIALFGGLIGGLAIIVWWAFFSRAPLFDRWGAAVLIIVSLAVTSLFLDDSIARSQLGMTFFLYSVPILSLAFVVWSVVSRRLPGSFKRVTMIATILLACGAWTLLRTNGMTSDIGHEFTWRWSATPEDRLLARDTDFSFVLPSTLAVKNTGADWPGFRGPERDGIIRNVQIETSWSTSPPLELWRRPVGPGWSSCAVLGDLLFTQEQLGENEVVSCYNVTTGKPVWRHSDATRFLGADANPGPRATPTLSYGRVYSFGATGILNALDAIDGSVVWSRNAVSDLNQEVPVWGFASSPLVIEELVLIHVASALVAYDAATGDPRWSAEVGTGYSSPHLLTIDGVAQILLLSGVGAVSFAPADGKILWEHRWPQEDRILQPALTSEGDLLVSSVLKGVRLITVTLREGRWNVEEHWTSNKLKSNFNDLVIHDGHAYGFDGPRLACIDLKDGTQKWKGGRYGGQLILLADQDLLLILSEKGELALVEAVPDQLNELERFAAVKGKTWNHPVLVGDLLLVRNGQEMVAFRLPLISS